MKREKQLKAIELRKQGLSLREIERLLKVSKSSVSRWVREVELSDKQIKKLSQNRKEGAYKSCLAGAQKNKILALNKRKGYQQVGKMDAQERGVDHKAFVALYWAEGNKDRNTFVFSNSDPHMLIFVINFLIQYYDIEKDKIAMYVNCYTNNGISVEEIEDFWLETLSLNKFNLRKTITNIPPNSKAGQKKGKLPYGVCRISIGNTELVQRIYGSINEYFGADSERWI